MSGWLVARFDSLLLCHWCWLICFKLIVSQMCSWFCIGCSICNQRFVFEHTHTHTHTYVMLYCLTNLNATDNQTKICFICWQKAASLIWPVTADNELTGMTWERERERTWKVHSATHHQIPTFVCLSFTVANSPMSQSSGLMRCMSVMSDHAGHTLHNTSPLPYTMECASSWYNAEVSIRSINESVWPGSRRCR